jgi:hypothetical protein
MNAQAPSQVCRPVMQAVMHRLWLDEMGSQVWRSTPVTSLRKTVPWCITQGFSMSSSLYSQIRYSSLTSSELGQAAFSYIDDRRVKRKWLLCQPGTVWADTRSDCSRIPCRNIFAASGQTPVTLGHSPGINGQELVCGCIQHSTLI